MAHAEKPLPYIGPDTEKFWAAAREKRLSLPVCDAYYSISSRQRSLADHGSDDHTGSKFGCTND